MEHGFFSDLKVDFFDLDGCVYYGDRLSQGIIPLLDQLRHQGIHYAFLTNNSRLSAAEIGERLAAMGMDVPNDCIFPVTDIAGLHKGKVWKCHRENNWKRELGTQHRKGGSPNGSLG